MDSRGLYDLPSSTVGDRTIERPSGWSWRLRSGFGAKRPGLPRTELCETRCKVGLACGIWCKVFTTLPGKWFEQAERARILKALVVGPTTAALWNSFMARMVKCIKLGREAEALDFPPYPGELGKRIFDNVSKEAWRQWLEHQKMLVNENRLNLADKKARDYLAQQMENHFFGSGADVASGYVPPSQK